MSIFGMPMQGHTRHDQPELLEVVFAGNKRTIDYQSREACVDTTRSPSYGQSTAATAPQQSPKLWPWAFVYSAVVPSQPRRVQLRGRLIVRSGGLQWWVELPALAPAGVGSAAGPHRCHPQALSSTGRDPVSCRSHLLAAEPGLHQAKLHSRCVTPGCCSAPPFHGGSFSVARRCIRHAQK